MIRQLKFRLLLGVHEPQRTLDVLLIRFGCAQLTSQVALVLLLDSDRVQPQAGLPLNWQRVSRLARHSQAMGEACKLAGYAFLPDQNGEFTDGYFPVTHSN